MDAELVRRYRDRWRAVAQIEAEEQRTATLTDRWLQLNAALRMAVALKLDLERHQADTGEEVVWLRWAQLKDKLG